MMYAVASILAASMVQSAPENARLVILASIITDASGELVLDAPSLLEAGTRIAEYGIGLEVVPRERVAAGGLETDLRACAADTACISERLRRAGATYLLAIVADTRKPPPIISTRLIAADPSAVVGSKLAALDANAPRAKALEAAIAEQLVALFESTRHPIGGRLIVDVMPPGATLSVDDPRARLRDANVFALSAGDHAVRARLDGHEDAVARARITPAADTRVAIVLDATASPVESPWFWAATGAAVVGTTAVLLLVLGGTPCKCFGTDPTSCPGCR